MMILTLSWLACTGAVDGSPEPSEGDVDTDADSDSDTDSDTDADTDTDTDTDTDVDTVTTLPGWPWGTTNGVGVADASFVGEGTDGAGFFDSVGDVDGNGHPDLLIGVLGSLLDESGEGSAVRVLLDGRTDWSIDMPLSALPSIDGTDAHEVVYAAMLGDINGDGRADLQIAENLDESNVYLMFGSSSLGSPTRSVDDPDAIVTLEDSSGKSSFTRLTPMGDVDGDALADVLFESPLRHGEAYVIPGAALHGDDVSAPTDATLWLHAGADVKPWFFAPGDITGDGFADVIAVDRNTNVGWVYGGGPDALPYDDDLGAAADATIEENGGSVTFVSLLGDLDADGVNDFSVDIGGGDVELGGHLFFGGPTIDGYFGPDDAKVTIAPGERVDAFENLGDVDGDGLNEVAFRALDATVENEADKFVVFGAEPWPDLVVEADADLHIPYTGSRLSVGADVDVNGDGLNDLLVYEDPEILGFGNPDSALLDVYVGRMKWPSTLTTGASSNADVRFENPTDGSFVPTFAVLDLDDDGFDDIVVPKMESDVFGVYEGTLYFMFGQPGP